MSDTMKHMYLIAKGTVQAFLMQRSKFTNEEVKQEIIKRGGVMRVSTCVTVKEYLNEFKHNGILKYVLDDKEGHYCVIKNPIVKRPQ